MGISYKKVCTFNISSRDDLSWQPSQQSTHMGTNRSLLDAAGSTVIQTRCQSCTNYLLVMIGCERNDFVRWNPDVHLLVGQFDALLE